MSLSRWVIRGFAVLAMGLPREIRERYGRDIEEVFRLQWTDASGPVARVGIVLHALAGLARDIPAEHLDLLRIDLRDSVRRIRRTPLIGFSVVATLALAIGANGAMFDVVDRLLFRDPPGVAEPSRVLRVYGAGWWRSATRAYPDYLDLAPATLLSHVAAYRTGREIGDAGGRRERLKVDRVSAEYFDALGVQLREGRWTGEADAAAVSPRFAARLEATGVSAIGATVALAGVRYQVSAVTEAFRGLDLEGTDVWLPLGVLPRDRGSFGAVHVIVRLAPGVASQAAAHEANALHNAGLRADGLPVDGDTMAFGPLLLTRGPAAPPEVRVSVWLWAVALLVLAAGLANAAQLLLARTLQGQRESQVRLTLGASVHRLRRQAWTDALVTATSSGIMAVAVATVGAPLVLRLLLPDLRADQGLEIRTTAGIAVMTVVAAVACALLPARALGRAAVWGGIPAWGANAARARMALAASQVALSMILLVGTALFARSLAAVAAIDTGFALEQLVSVRVDGRGAGLTPPDEAALLARLAETATREPGAAAVGLTHTVPFESSWRTPLYLPGRDPERFIDAGGGRVNVLSTFLSGDAARAFDLRLLEGRQLNAGDSASSERVTVVTPALARLVARDGVAIGQCLYLLRPDAPCTRIVGVVGGTRFEQLFEPAAAQSFLPLSQAPRGEVATAMVVRSAGSPERLAATLEGRLGALLPSGVTLQARPLLEAVAPVRRPWTLGATVFMVFGGLSVAITAAGLFAMLAHAVTQEARGLGIRRALGAPAAHIALVVARTIARPTALGLAGGGIAAVAGSHAIAGLLYGIDGGDALSYAMAAGGVGVTAAVAAWLPVCWALRIDAVGVLRDG